MRRLIVGAVAVTALSGGAAVAVAATNDAKQAEQAVLSDAAKRLNVSPDELRSALGAAGNAQLDAAVTAGRLTREQADQVKQHRAAHGGVLKLGPGGHGGFDRGPGGFGGRGALIGDAAGALGIGRAELVERLRSGETLTELAKAEGKNLADVKAAVEQSASKRLDADVKAGRVTEAQRDGMAKHLADHVDHLGERPKFPGRGGMPGRFRDATNSDEGVAGAPAEDAAYPAF